MKNHTLVVCLFCFCFLQTVSLQAISFKQLSLQEGLSHYSVMALYQDERDFIWIGTRNGVNVYNGNECKVYKYEKDNPNSLFCNTVNQITGDGNGSVFLLTIRGVAHYNISTEHFTTIWQRSVTAMCYHDALYVGLNNGVYKYEEERFRLIYELPDPDMRITALYMEDNSLLMGTNGQGLFILPPEGELYQPIGRGRVTQIYKSSNEHFWVGTWEDGFYTGKNKEWKNFRSQPGNKNTLSADFVRFFCEDKQGIMWIGTYNGLNRYDRISNQFSHYLQREDETGEDVHSSVWSLLCDHQGTMWVGTYFGGIRYFNPEKDIYRLYHVSRQEGKGLSSPTVGKMTEDKEGNLWICTEGGGLNRYTPQTGYYTWYKQGNSANTLSHNNVKSIWYDEKRDAMWVGTHLGGLNRLDLKSGNFTRYMADERDPESLPSNNIIDIISWKDELILATHGGVCRFHPETGKVIRMFTETYQGKRIDFALDLMIDTDNVLWISGSEDGAYAYHLPTGRLTNYAHNHAWSNSISSNRINSVYQDSQGEIWICSAESGIDRYRKETDDFENLDEQSNGLASNCVYGISELPSGRLLCITDAGFSILDKSTHQFTNYNYRNGVPLAAINQAALYRTHDGEIFIGGTEGLFSFYEDDLETPPASYGITPYRLRVNGNEIKPGDETAILNYSLTETGDIVFPASTSMFTIEYAVSNYMPSHREDVVYQLKGFSDSWTSTRGRHEITYTNLNPGRYTLIVRALSPAEEVIAENQLRIRILPPFYKTVWAWLFYIAAFVALATFLIHTNNNKIKLQASLKYERKHSEEVEKLNQSKLRFFTNISHEFRTPLTLIIGQMEQLMQLHSFTPTVYNKVLNVYKSSLQLRELITELLDFRKQEQGFMKIKTREQDLVAFLYENYLLFKELAAKKQIRFTFECSINKIGVWYDAKQMQKVINNLLSNAFRHTPEQGTISLSIAQEGAGVAIKVTDNGVGIPPDEIDKIFDRFYQTEKMDSISQTGTGIGLALTKGIIELHKGSIFATSQPGQQTTFTVRLPLGNAHLEPSQIDTSEPVTILNPKIENKPAGITAGEPTETDEVVQPVIQGATLLIVEDNEALCTMLQQLFEPFYRIETASNGKVGWESARTLLPDIILSDIVMPEMTGIELCKLVKTDRDTCHIPVVLLTARTALESNLEGLRTGADDYITKPFHTDILISRCNNLVNSRVLLKEKFSNLPQSSPQMLATNPLDKEFIDNAIRVIEKHIDNPDFGVDLFAEEMGVARTKLFNKLKAIAGQTPYEFILTLRLKKAAVMLKNNPEYNISEISDRLGFSSPRYFSKCFKEKYNLIPQAYRKGKEVPPDKEETDENESLE